MNDESRRKSEECRRVQESLSALLDGELDKEEADAVLKRIEKCAETGCRDCTELLEDLRQIECICRDPDAECNPPPEVLHDLRSRLLRMVRGEH